MLGSSEIGRSALVWFEWMVALISNDVSHWFVRDMRKCVITEYGKGRYMKVLRLKTVVGLISAICLTLMSLQTLAGELKADDRIWIDVRSQAEHFIDAIDADTRVDWDDIVPYVEQQFPDKSQSIGLYCRSGGRAGKAKAALEAAGYSNVLNAGSIDDARQTREIE